MTRSASSWHSVNKEEHLNSSKVFSNSNKASSNSKDSSSHRNRDFSNSRDFSSSRVSNSSHSKDFNSSHSRVSLDRVLLLPSSRPLPSRPRCRPDQRYFSM